MERSRRRRRLLGGALAGGLAGIVTGAVIATAAPRVHEQGEPDVAVRSLIDAAHVPPLLTLPGEPVTLRYAILCPAPGDAPFGGAPCDASGDVYIRTGSVGPFTRLPLRRTDDSLNGRYVFDVPPSIAASRDGFSYYAVLRNDATGASMMLPAAGAAAPQRSLPLDHAMTVRLGSHRFGSTRPADDRIVEAPWGTAVGEVGLGGSLGGLRIGPSSFDVAADGTIALLDGNNSRIDHWSRGGVSAVHADLDGAVDDLALAADGSAYVLDGRGRPPLLRHLGRDGRLLAGEPIVERTWSQLRLGADGPVVQQEPSEQWLRAAPGLTRAEKLRSGEAGRPLADGSELVVLRTGVGELRLARVAGGSTRIAWRILSDTPLGEVQLAQPAGNRLVVVVKAYTDAADEFVVLILDGRGLVRQFSLTSAEWAASAPLARFRLVGSSLYQLGSTPDGAFVDRYDLGVAR
jgi:hypothetical protein